ncbi:unnamed protein product [Cunninghamella echinulata]
MNPQREQLTQLSKSGWIICDKRILNALTSLYNEEKEDTTLLKDIIRAFTIILPPVFLTIC